MDSKLKAYDEILYTKLRPWMPENKNEKILLQKYEECKTESYAFQAKFKLLFKSPYSIVRKYYVKLIDQTAIGFLNFFHADMASCRSDNEKKYLVHQALHRILKQKLVETGRLIVERQYHSNQFESTERLNAQTLNLANESYVMHYLKNQLVRLYLEIQESYQLLIENPINIEELYFDCFKENAPQVDIITEADRIPDLREVLNEGLKKNTPPFQSKRFDIRPVTKGIISYEQLIKNAKLFDSMEEYLYDQGFIDENFVLSEKHGVKTFMAAFYHQLIKMNYFNARSFPSNHKIEPIHIRKFLDWRYQTNIDRQFRELHNDDDKLLGIIDKDLFLSTIPKC